MTVTIVETRTQARAITGGVDTHADVHVAAALDPIGGLLGVHEFPATAAGYARLLEWLGGPLPRGCPAGRTCLVRADSRPRPPRQGDHHVPLPRDPQGPDRRTASPGRARRAGDPHPPGPPRAHG